MCSEIGGKQHVSKYVFLSEGDMTFCSDKPTGYYPDPKDCNSFYQCADGITYWKHCPEGLYFNPVNKVCDWPRNVECTAEGQQDKQMRCPHGIRRISQILKKSKCLERKSSDEGIIKLR